nr:unnamed protein product [Digitaria exilis]
MMRWGSSGQAADSFYQVRPDCSQNVPSTKYKIKGVHPAIRGEVWEFLLGCYDPGSTFDERDQIRHRRRMQYSRWKEECREMDSHVGSGKIITAPIITEDGFPIKDPLVLLEAASETQGTPTSSSGIEVSDSTNRVMDGQIIDWKLTLHQIETLGGGDYLFAFRMFMVLFRRELSFGDSLYLWEMMWALEYDPDIFCTYEETGAATDRIEGFKPKVKSVRQFGKYERQNMKNGASDGDEPVPISVFLVASVLKENSPKLLQEARGIDDVIRILNNVNGDLDAKRTCAVALKLHRKYLKKGKKT